MDALSDEIMNSIHSNQSSFQDSYQEININTINSATNDNEINESMAVNMSNLNSSELTEILKQNQTLSRDFFRFGLYRTVDSNVLFSILKTFKVSPQDVESLLEYITELREYNLLYIFLNQNIQDLTEKEILLTILFILSLKDTPVPPCSEILEDPAYLHFGDLQVFLFSIILRHLIDRNYFINLLNTDKSKGLFIRQNYTHLYHILKKIFYSGYLSEIVLVNLEHYLFIISNLVMFSFLNKEIEAEDCEKFKNDIDQFEKDISINKLKTTSAYDENSLMIQFYKNSNRDDISIERTKI